MLSHLINWLLPQQCLICKNPSHSSINICQLCYLELPHLASVCSQCAALCPEEASICGKCLTTKPPFDQTFALFAYTPPISNLILDLKFNSKLHHGRLLGQLMAEKIRGSWYYASPFPEIILPVPLDSKRIAQRGFNQALEIAKPIAKQLNIPLEKDLIKRIKPTLAQATLSLKDRQQNIKNAFQVSKNLNFQHVALLDDIMTTGNTIKSVATLLKKQGVKKIDIWCCARSMQKNPRRRTGQF